MIMFSKSSTNSNFDIGKSDCCCHRPVTNGSHFTKGFKGVPMMNLRYLMAPPGLWRIVTGMGHLCMKVKRTVIENRQKTWRLLHEINCVRSHPKHIFFIL